MTSFVEQSTVALQDVCPACASDVFVEVGFPGESFSVEIKGRQFVQPAFVARRCRRCHLVFKSAVASLPVLADYYRAVDFRKWENKGLYPSEQPVADALAKLPPKSRVLDFGCSVGRLLGQFSKIHSCYGVEINPDAAKIAQSRGITMISPDQFDDEGIEGSFDAVVSVDVFEHLFDPLETLGRLAKLLRGNGKLYVVTGNSEAPAVRGDPARFWYFGIIEHLCMLNSAHARFIASSLGLTLTKEIEVSHYDWKWKDRWMQRISQFAYDGFHRSKSRWLPTLLGFVPKLRKARHWTKPPICDCTADHLVLEFERSSATTAAPPLETNPLRTSP